MKRLSMKAKARLSDYVRREVLKNLLTTQKRSAEVGDAKAVIRLSKYLLRTFKECNDEFIEIGTEGDEQGCNEPVTELK